MRSKKTTTLTYAAALRDSFDIALTRDSRVFLIGEGIPDPKGAFGTTTGLQEKFGRDRIMDMPVAENGMTGVCIGAAIGGMRPILTHMRVDFSLLSMDQIVNCAAKWYAMFGGKVSVPLVIRMIIGRGWGQGPQHSQSLQALFAHIPGLKVVMPTTPSDAKGLMLSAIADPNPVIFIEHRWLHALSGEVPTGYYETPIGVANVVRSGSHITLVSSSYMTVEGIRAAARLEKRGVSLEVIDLRSISPIDWKSIFMSLKKTKRLLVADTGQTRFGISAEIVAKVSEEGSRLLYPPARIGLPDYPTPTSWSLAESYYPTSETIVRVALDMMGIKQATFGTVLHHQTDTGETRSDQPDPSFIGPF